MGTLEGGRAGEVSPGEADRGGAARAGGPSQTPTPLGVFRNQTPVCTTLGSTAVPYPSDITVSGMPTQLGGLKVKFYNFWHIFPDNFDALLVARTERQGEHRVTFWASIDGGAGQMIVAGDHLDSDQDGLLDHWETQGIDLEGTGVIDLDLPAMGANPFKFAMGAGLLPASVDASESPALLLTRNSVPPSKAKTFLFE